VGTPRNANLGVCTNAFLGLAVTSHSTNATQAKFRDLGDTVSTVTQAVPTDLEPPGPSSRRTGS